MLTSPDQISHLLTRELAHLNYGSFLPGHTNLTPLNLVYHSLKVNSTKKNSQINRIVSKSVKNVNNYLDHDTKHTIKFCTISRKAQNLRELLFLIFITNCTLSNNPKILCQSFLRSTDVHKCRIARSRI